MILLKTIKELQAYRRQLEATTLVGFVPTMGALHEGHAELLRQCAQKCQVSILSIFVNKTQFNDPKDYEKYPSTLEQDLQLAEQCGVSAVFFPQHEEMYPDHYRFKIQENKLSLRLCGAHRPGHFDGVLSIVMKLFQLTKPHLAFFGEKDYQQLLLIQDLVAAFFMDLQIVPVAAVRETDGLAMSSRNRRLTADERKKAPLFYKYLTESAAPADAIALLEQAGFVVDYVEDLYGRRFGAVHLGLVRLIDNVKISEEPT